MNFSRWCLTQWHFWHLTYVVSGAGVSGQIFMGMRDLHSQLVRRRMENEVNAGNSLRMLEAFSSWKQSLLYRRFYIQLYLYYLFKLRVCKMLPFVCFFLPISDKKRKNDNVVEQKVTTCDSSIRRSLRQFSKLFVLHYVYLVFTIISNCYSGLTLIAQDGLRFVVL
jgi:hypothetical protein